MKKKNTIDVWPRWVETQSDQSIPSDSPTSSEGSFRFLKGGVVRFFCVANETSFIVTRSDCRGWPIYQHNKTFLSLHISTYRQHSSPSGMQNVCHINLRSLEYEMLWDEVTEWLRRWTANPMCSAYVGSNPILVVGSRRDWSGLVVVLFFSAAKLSLSLPSRLQWTTSSLSLPPV